MKKAILLILFVISFSTISNGQESKRNYQILFNKNCTASDAYSIVYDAYSEVMKIKDPLSITKEMIVEDSKFNYGKITVSTNEALTKEQLDKIYTNENIMSYEVSMVKHQMITFIHGIKTNVVRLKKASEYPNFVITFRYNFNVNPKDEVNFISSLFGEDHYLFEKDANEIEISVPENTPDYFLKKLKENKSVVSVASL